MRIAPTYVDSGIVLSRKDCGVKYAKKAGPLRCNDHIDL
jgi:hypothetical protein